ncbi:TIR domain-containing protein [Deinococcus antarcticus]|uniref:TIR domain-containing protein n=1 Tax=Deinococcus antarcticus TaxID=1298767 RepID=A0ABV8A8V1_9DEIO
MRNVFYSFHYANDAVRASQVRHMGVITGNEPCSDNNWEAVKRGGDLAIQRWIDKEMVGRTCLVVLVGSQTCGRKWIDYEIKHAWNNNKGVVAVKIHQLKNFSGLQSTEGGNPFAGFNLTNGTSLSRVAKVYNPPYYDSKDVYKYIHDNLPKWIEEAIAIRKAY